MIFDEMVQNRPFDLSRLPIDAKIYAESHGSIKQIDEYYQTFKNNEHHVENNGLSRTSPFRINPIFDPTNLPTRSPILDAIQVAKKSRDRFQSHTKSHSSTQRKAQPALRQNRFGARAIRLHPSGAHRHAQVDGRSYNMFKNASV